MERDSERGMYSSIYLYIFIHVCIYIYRYRFAVSEAPSLIQLREEFFSFVGDNSPLIRMANIFPHGGMASPSIIQCLHDTLSLKGYLHNVFEQIRINPEFAWILNFPHSSLPVGSRGVQSSVLSILVWLSNV